MHTNCPTCAIPAGDYRIGDDIFSDSRPVHVVTLNAFHIGESVVTNGRFAHFIAAGGYQNQSLWSEIGWRWLQSKKLGEPAFWQDANFNHALQPVVGVSWYEADAFARWCSLRSGQPWRLPTEAEWESAARGPKHHDGPVSGRINSMEAGQRRPWPAFGTGNLNWCGAHDMFGNVWEWTSTRWGHNWQSLDYPYPYSRDDGREDLDGSHARVMRGGSFFNTKTEAKAGFRARFLPGSRASNIGFRLAISEIVG